LLVLCDQLTGPPNVDRYESESLPVFITVQLKAEGSVATRSFELISRANSAGLL
jgi:hypothetical protein